MPTYPSSEAACPCGGYAEAETFGACCGPFVVVGEPAPTPEQVMRSRYTAFAVRDADHLWRTWHPRTRPREVGDLDGMSWTGLQVLDASGRDDDVEGSVTFVAHYVTPDGARGQLGEHSRFAKRAGRWFYIDGDEVDGAGRS